MRHERSLKKNAKMSMKITQELTIKIKTHVRYGSPGQIEASTPPSGMLRAFDKERLREI